MESRVLRLERANRWLWLALAVAIAAPLVTEFIGRPAVGVEPKKKTLEERVEVLEAYNKKALELSVQTMIEVMARSEIECRGIAVVDDKRNPRILLSGGEKGGSSSVSMVDRNGRSRLELIVSPEGSAIIRNLDAAGKLRLAHGSLPDGTPTIVFEDSKGKAVNLLDKK